MIKDRLPGYQEALGLTMKQISPPTVPEEMELTSCLGRILFEDLFSKVHSPSVDASMKDGYALAGDEIRRAAPDAPVILDLAGTVAAGEESRLTVTAGTAVRILTGAAIPAGATSVLSEEFAACKEGKLEVFNHAHPGRNILKAGADLSLGEQVGQKGSCLTPGMIGTLAAAGFSSLPVFPSPRVAILATGDELIPPGSPLKPGQLYASNLMMLQAWCRRFHMETGFYLIGDAKDKIRDTLAAALAGHDAVITSGGAWTGEKDFMAGILEELGWEKLFRAVRMGPGKGVGFGILKHKPVFMLPGGPPSSMTAFVNIALPGLLKLGGYRDPGLPEVTVRLTAPAEGRSPGWSEFIYGRLEKGKDHTLFTPLEMSRRLPAMAAAQAIVTIPEDRVRLEKDTLVTARILNH